MPQTPVETLRQLPRRARESHKGTYGSVLVTAGSRGMAGAAGLAGMAAMRAGAGLTRIACPAGIEPIVAGFSPCAMTCPLPETPTGGIAFPVAQEILEREDTWATVMAVGPGLGRSDDIRNLISWLIARPGSPAVLDADALNALAEIPNWWLSVQRPLILTPHPGEFARLAGASKAEIFADGDREAALTRFLSRIAPAPAPVVVVLKGWRTLVADAVSLYRNATGNPGMAVGGTGDVLTGVIAALVAQGLTPFEAAALGVNLHGAAGDRARISYGEAGLMAADLPQYVAEVIRDRESEQPEN